MKKRHINLHLNIIVECSEEYAEKLLLNPTYQAQQKAWRNNGRTVLGVKAYELTEEQKQDVC